MRKKLDTRFPAARIKKIMQTDEDVGKIAMAVPLLVSKALELFLQDLCNRTYDITIQRGAKTVNSFHLKQCVQSFNVFDFLRENVDKVPDLGGSDASNEGSAVKRRKIAEDEELDNGDEVRKERMWLQEDNIQGSIGGRGRGKGRSRGRGRGRGGRTAEVSTVHCEQSENDSGISPRGDMEKTSSGPDNDTIPGDLKETVVASVNTEGTARNFDLNVDLDENGDSAAMPVTAATVSSSIKPTFETKHVEYPGWSYDDMVRMAFDPVQLANLDRRVDEEEEDYDEED